MQSHLTQLSRGSIRFTSDGNALLHLPTSKTDQFRQGSTIPLAASYDTTCPVTALKTLYHRYPKHNSDPLLSKLIGAFNQSWVIQRLHSLLRTAGINPEGFSGHSFRRGAVNSAIQAGISRQDDGSRTPWIAIFLLHQKLKTFWHSPNSCTLILAPRFLRAHLSTILLASHLAAPARILRGVEIDDWGLTSGESARSLAQPAWRGGVLGCGFPKRK